MGLDQKLQKFHQHIFCKRPVTTLQGIVKTIFSENNGKKH